MSWVALLRQDTQEELVHRILKEDRSMRSKIAKNTKVLAGSPIAGGTKALNDNEPVTERKYVTVKQMLTFKKYGWATESFLRHAIFQAEGRMGSGGATVPGNGLAPAILRIGRKVLIDLDEFDHWVEQQRMQPVASRKSARL